MSVCLPVVAMSELIILSFGRLELLVGVKLLVIINVRVSILNLFIELLSWVLALIAHVSLSLS